MDKKNAYIWYSGATDVTGKALETKLGITGGREKPKGKELVIGWGAKTKEDVDLGKTAVLNHPNNIRRNRNKFKTLGLLKDANVAVADFVSAEKVKAEIGKKVSLPLVGRTNYHQGGKGFWLCLTKSHVENAIREGAQYFQNYIDIVDEYRVHVFRGKVIHAQKKVRRNNMEEAYVKQHADKIKDYAQKGDVKIDENTLKYALQRVAKEHQNADMIVRSNRRGWKFSNIKLSPNKAKEKALIDVSISALGPIGMDFGAVDCCLDSDGKAWIIEINSGPGLEGKTFEAYLARFEEELNNAGKKEEKKPAKAKAKAPKAKAVGADAESGLAAGNAKSRLKGMRELLDLVEDADDTEAAAIEKLIRRKLGA